MRALLLPDRQAANAPPLPGCSHDLAPMRALALNAFDQDLESAWQVLGKTYKEVCGT